MKTYEKKQKNPRSSIHSISMKVDDCSKNKKNLRSFIHSISMMVDVLFEIVMVGAD